MGPVIPQSPLAQQARGAPQQTRDGWNRNYPNPEEAVQFGQSFLATLQVLALLFGETALIVLLLRELEHH